MKAIALVFAAVLAAAAFAAEKPATHGIAVLIPGKDSKVAGTVHFKKEAGGVRVTGTVTGLAAGNHGFHIHEFGDCSAADFTSAGGHFNPAGNPHAGPKDAKRHEGDMGNIEADASGNAKLDYVDHHISLTNDEQSVIGRSVVVHAKADDLKSQPAGDSGARIACGVIGITKSH